MGKSEQTNISGSLTTMPGYIELIGSNALDKNVPDIIEITLRWCGMSDPLGRPVVYNLYTNTFADEGQLTSYKKNMATPCAMKLNGEFLKKVRSKTYGSNEIYSRYTTKMVIDRQKYYILNIYAENDVGGKAYTVFLSAPPKGDLDMLKETQNQIILAIGVLLFGIVVGCTMYWGKIRPAAVEKAQMAVLEERSLIEEQKQQKERKNKLKRNRKGVAMHLPG